MLGGLTDSLLGLTKGDHCLIGIPPSIFYSNTTTSGSSLVDITSRNYPGAWLLVEVEIVKVKSNDSKNNKKEKKKEENMENTTTIPFASSSTTNTTTTGIVPPQSESPVQRIVKRMNTSGSFDEHSNTGGSGGNREVAARMARISSAGGAQGVQLAGIMNPHLQQQPHQPQQQQQSYSQQEEASQYTQSSQPPQQQLQQQRHSDHYPPQQHHQQQQQYNQHHSRPQQGGAQQGGAPYSSQQGGAQQGGAPYSENRLAVVEGQGVRSFYTDTGDENPNYYQPSGYANTGNSYPSQQQPFPSAQDQQLTASGVNLLQQSISTIQQSMLSLHTKLDQVGNNVTMNISMQQQLQQQQSQQQGQLYSTYMNNSMHTTTPGVGILGMGMPGAGGIMGMQQNYMNPQLAYQQQQQQLQQLQQSQQQLLNNTTNTTATSTATPVRIKTNDIVYTLQALLTEYEQQQQLSNNTPNNTTSTLKESEYKDTIKSLQSTVERLEGKNENLQVNAILTHIIVCVTDIKPIST